jgi:hypothetical protein
MNINEIDNVLRDAITGKKALSIQGYTDSDGNVSNLVVSFLPAKGYQALQFLSAKTLEKELKEKPSENKEAKEAVLVELVKKLNGPAPDGDGPSAFAVADPESRYVNSLFVWSQTFTKEVESTRKSAALVIAKNELKKRLPIGRQIFRLKLAPGKFSSLATTPIPTDSAELVAIWEATKKEVPKWT